MTAPISAEESERLRVLYQYEILDTIAEEAFDDLTRLAATMCGAEIATITFVDEHRQWFKSATGTERAQSPREVSFCAHTILKNEVMMVEDASKDERFASNALVTGDPKIRFYAGAPLVVKEGVALGALCVIGREPRSLSREQTDSLQALARQVVAQLELRRALNNLRRIEGAEA